MPWLTPILGEFCSGLGLNYTFYFRGIPNRFFTLVQIQSNERKIVIDNNPPQSNEIETKVAEKCFRLNEAHTISTARTAPNSDNNKKKSNNQQNPVNNIKRNELEKNSDIIVIEGMK